MDEFVNPFRPGAGTSPPALIGRDHLLARFDLTARRAAAGRPGKSVMLIGLRGVGKTVLLSAFSESAVRHGLRVAYLEATESGDFKRLLALRLRSVLVELDRSATTSRLTRRALAALRSFTLGLPDGATISIDVEALAGVADSGQLAEDATDLLVEVGRAAQERRTGLVIAIDEVQYLAPDELAALITAIHRTNQLDLPIVLVGAGLPQLPGLVGEARSYAERLFDFPVVHSLSHEDAAAALRIPAAQHDVRFTADALDMIVERTRGYPYFLQEWGYEVWNVAAASPVTTADVAAASPLVSRRLDENFFLIRLDRLTPSEKVYLRAMAELGPGPHRSGDIAGRLGVRVETSAPRRAGLIHKGMIYSPAHGETAFTVPLFDEFLRRHLPDGGRG